MSLLTVHDIPVTRFHCDFRLTNTVLSSEFAFEHNLQHTASIPLLLDFECRVSSQSATAPSSLISRLRPAAQPSEATIPLTIIRVNPSKAITFYDTCPDKSTLSLRNQALKNPVVKALAAKHISLLVKG
ncbi:hypothetical protein K435DRAFT_874023 [Dendrothele bispora CBS 962.96]|uniref:Uncharacterized protein n=1 Tax=Dendrothele bispora (strain CBS 962.96) TaxID=1314807 RepID=A0A4S8KXN8_DENBC|nr:hypothetical protein K435DRAFT_874023 [Dendrothele bispora CBS 962.96]